MSIAQTVSCLDGYDPDALRVDKAREAILACLSPITEVEQVPIQAALGRVLAEEIVPRINVPAHDNSAMDGYAFAFPIWNVPLEGNRHGPRRQAVPRQARRWRVRAHHDRRRNAARRGHRRHPGSRKEGERPRRAHHHPARPEEGAERALRRRRPQGRRSRARPGKMAQARGRRPHRLPRHRRSPRASASYASRSSPPATSSPPSASRSRKARSTTPTAIPCTACWRGSASRRSIWG